MAYLSRKSLRRPSSSSNTLASKHQSRLDVWLIRGSHIAQVGVLALTVTTLFYTVIPLYRTALLEEQIARREIEIKEADIRLAQTEAAVKDAKEQLYRQLRSEAQRDYVFRAGAECSGLLRRPMDLILLGERSSRIDERPLLVENYADCLKQEMEKRKTTFKLTVSDEKAFVDEVTSLGQRLENRRAEAHLHMRAIEGMTIEAIVKFAPPGPYVQEHEKLREKIDMVLPGVLQRNQQEERVRAIRRAKEKISNDLEYEVRAEISKLRDFAWPN